MKNQELITAKGKPNHDNATEPEYFTLNCTGLMVSITHRKCQYRSFEALSVDISDTGKSLEFTRIDDHESRFYGSRINLKSGIHYDYFSCSIGPSYRVYSGWEIEDSINDRVSTSEIGRIDEDKYATYLLINYKGKLWRVSHIFAKPVGKVGQLMVLARPFYPSDIS